MWQDRPMVRCVVILLVAGLLCVAAFAQDKPARPEQPSGPEGSGVTTEAQEEARQSLIRRIEARKLIRELPDGQKRDSVLEALEKLGAEAVEELLASKEPHAIPSLQELCRRWVGVLGSDDFVTRDRAFRLLFAAGDIGAVMVKGAADSRDVDLSHRAKLLLHMIDYRISPQLYERLGHAMADFGQSDWRKKIDMLVELERLGGPLAVPVLKRIMLREKNPRVQAQAANSLVRVGSLEDLLFLRRIGLAEKIREPAITTDLYLSQGLKYMVAERYEEAIEEFKKALQTSPADFRAHYEIAMAYLMSKKFALAVTHFKECVKQHPKDHLSHYNLACAYSLMNDVDNAIKHLALSIENGYDDLEHMEKDPDLDNIRSDPRYGELKKRLQREKVSPGEGSSE